MKILIRLFALAFFSFPYQPVFATDGPRPVSRFDQGAGRSSISQAPSTPKIHRDPRFDSLRLAAVKSDSGATGEPAVVRGVFKMRDLYQSGVDAYRAKDYEKAIRYLKCAISFEDPYTSRYYYAEAHCLLGVIYQFFYPVTDHISLAKMQYEAALRIDPQTHIAKKHLAEVSETSRN